MNFVEDFCVSLGADISDYFNYGFTEETWAAYCDRQRRLRAEATAKGMVVSNSTSNEMSCELKE